MDKRYDVFISYSSHDQKTVEGICGYLERKGYRCFVAFRDIPRGVVWASAIAEALDASKMMVVVFSNAFNVSPQTDREIEIASENRMPILTYRVTDSEMTGAKKYYLKNLNWIDAFPNPEAYFGQLLDSVVKLIGPSALEVENAAKMESERLAKEAAEKERQERERKAREEAERKAREEAERKAREQKKPMANPVSQPETSKPVADRPKNKKGLWIGLGIAAVMIVALLVILLPSSKESSQPNSEEVISKMVDTELPYHLDYKVIFPNNYTDDQEMHERNVLSVYVSLSGRLIVSKNGVSSVCDLNNLKDVIVDFMTPRSADMSAPETEYISVNSIGEVQTTKGLILIHFEQPSATTEDIAAINELAKAFAALREEMAMKAFHKHLNQLNNEEHEAIRKAVPVRVVGIGEHIWSPQIIIVENDVAVDEDVVINNAFVETCIKKVDDLNGIKTIVDDFNKNKVEVEEETDVEQEIFNGP